jgi:hypothetical protein
MAHFAPALPELILLQKDLSSACYTLFMAEFDPLCLKVFLIFTIACCLFDEGELRIFASLVQRLQFASLLDEGSRSEVLLLR